MENVAVVVFKVPSEGYQAFTRLEQEPITPGYTVSQFDLVERKGDQLVPHDRGDSGVNTRDDVWKGGLIGTLVGILGGPMGILLGGAAGATVGIALDASDAVQNDSMLGQAAGKLFDGEVALLALVQEDDPIFFDRIFDGLDCTIIRYDAADIAQEIEEAREAQKALEKQAKESMKAQRKADRQQKVEERRASIKASFAEFKSKFE
ncbi:MAG: hypothetical protein IJ087_07150 [Eggerthellaceae bacterium]|nr:hypothetical protein [Eggerthellaceae bacterium]